MYLFTLIGSLSLSAADLTAIKTVYLLPMSRGLDQYLGERLTTQGVAVVVTDPQKADAIFTDRIGSNFEESLTELFNNGAPVAEKQDESVYRRPAMQPLSRGKGNIFLVDKKTHEVIWSIFVEPKGTDSKDLNRVAGQVADRLLKVRKSTKEQ